MKARRQLKILEIIRSGPVETQEELAEKLKQEGILVTQATISRDIRDLGLMKVPNGDGRHRYSQAEEPTGNPPGDRLLKIFRDCVLNIDYSENLVVVTTLTATADAVCEAIDGLRVPEVIGTMSGERTVFLVVRPTEAAAMVTRRLMALLS